jgi:hypothetical protein
MQLQNFSKILLRSKNKVFGPVQRPKKTFINFFHLFLGVFVPVPVPNTKKWFRFGTGTKTSRNR